MTADELGQSAEYSFNSYSLRSFWELEHDDNKYVGCGYVLRKQQEIRLELPGLAAEQASWTGWKAQQLKLLDWNSEPTVDSW